MQVDLYLWLPNVRLGGLVPYRFRHRIKGKTLVKTYIAKTIHIIQNFGKSSSSRC